MSLCTIFYNSPNLLLYMMTLLLYLPFKGPFPGEPGLSSSFSILPPLVWNRTFGDKWHRSFVGQISCLSPSW